MGTLAVVQVDGGIGRVLCSTHAIIQLAKRQDVVVLTSCPEVFWNNPSVHKVYGLSNNDYLWDDVIRHGEFFYPEPYHNYKYYTQRHHLSQSFNFLLNGDEEFSEPKLFLTQEERLWASEFIEARRKDGKRPVAMLQWCGAGVQSEDGRDPSYRSLSKDAVRQLVTQTEVTYINASHLSLEGQMNVWQQQFTLRQIFALTEQCDFVVTVDSCLSHIGAAFHRRGILILGGTYSQNVGYPNYRIVSRDNYPKAYHPNRFKGFIPDVNLGAMDFSKEECQQLIEILNKQEFSPLAVE